MRSIISIRSASFVASLLMLANVGFAQDTIWLDKNILPCKKEKAHIYRVLIKHPPDSVKATERTYFMSGQIRSERHFTNYEKQTVNGRLSEWYEDGKPKKEIGYLDGTLHGYVKTFYPTGKPRRDDFYESGRMEIGKCFDEKGNEIKYYPYYVAPQAKVKDSLQAYLLANTVFPDSEKSKTLKDSVRVGIILDKTGAIKEAKVIHSGTSKAFDDEGLRVVKSIPGWMPAKLDGEPVPAVVEITVRFEVM